MNASETNDWLTVAAIGLLVMCMVTVDHEALGHGGACLVAHGRIQVLTSSIFRCNIQSPLIDPAGPAMNMLCGLVALIVRLLLPLRLVRLRLFLILVTGLSFFWEGGYLIHGMHHAEGDLYFFLQGWLGGVTVWQRWLAAAAGLTLYVISAIITSGALLELWPDARHSRRVARIVWLSATMGAALAALAYRGGTKGDLRDAVLEIGAASNPLLFIPIRSRQHRDGDPQATIARSYPLIALAIVVYGAFVATLGHGLP